MEPTDRKGKLCGSGMVGGDGHSGIMLEFHVRAGANLFIPKDKTKQFPYLKPHTGLVSKELHNKREPGSELTHNIDIRAQE